MALKKNDNEQSTIPVDAIEVVHDEEITSDVPTVQEQTQNLPDYAILNPEIPMTSYYANLRANVQAIRDTGYVQWNTPAVPSSPLNTFQKWNNIEKILFDAHNTLDDNFYYGQYGADDEIYSGEDAGLVL